VPNLGKRIEERFGVFPNFFRLAPETPEITEKLWGFAEAAYLDNPLPSVLRSVFSFTCRAFAQSAIASVVMLVSWWDLAVPLAIRLGVLKVLRMWLSSFDGLSHAGKNFSLVYRCAQPALHPLLKCRRPTHRWKTPFLCWQLMFS